MTESVEPARHYDRVTDAWTLILGDELHYGVFDSLGDGLAVATGRLTSLMIDAARLRGPAEVLDVGCGTGATACQLAADHGARVFGITTSRVGVEAATARARRVGVEALATFEQRDGTDNGLPAAAFDIVWVLESSHLMRKRERLVSECGRVLRPGGRLVLCDVVLDTPMDFDTVKSLREPLALLRSVFGDARMEPLDRYAQWFAAIGLVVGDRLDLTAATRPTFAAWRHRVDEHRPALVEKLGRSEIDKFVASTYVLEQLWDDGTLGYGLIAASKSG